MLKLTGTVSLLLLTASAAAEMAPAPDAGTAPPSEAPAEGAAPPQEQAGETAAPARQALPSAAEREARLAAELRARPELTPAAVAIPVESEEVLGLYLEETTGRPQGALLLLHDIGAHPDWPAVIGPLRRELPRWGWHTLALQLPLPEGRNEPSTWSGLLDASLARAQAAVAFLKAQGLHNIAVAGHGIGALVGAHLLTGSDKSVRALVAIGMAGYPQEERLDAAALLARLSVPILDLYGSEDRLSVTDSAERRAAAARRARVDPETPQPHPARRAGNDPKHPPGYRQVEVNGAGHDFTGQETRLVRRVAGWLDRHVSGRTIKNQPTEETP